MKITSILSYTQHVVVDKNKGASFAGKPKEINNNSIDAKTLNSYLSKASYWDSADDSFDINCKKNRTANLNNFDKLNNHECDKFVKNYSYTTGFPDLEEVSKNIENEFILATYAASKKLSNKGQNPEYNILLAGYDGTCSVGKKVAFPGSDLDRAYVILQGCDDSYDNKKIADEFSGKLWEYTDQRLLSYNHYKSFPIVRTLKQISDDFSRYDFCVTFNEREQYLKEMSNYADDDFIGVNSFLVDKSKKVSADNKVNFVTNAYLAEVLREGNTLKKSIEGNEDEIKKIKDSSLYKYSNITQLHAIKNNEEFLEDKYKQKRAERKKLVEQYPNYTSQEKLNLIKTLFAASCELNTQKEDLFKNTQDIGSHVEKLLSELMFERSDFNLTPKVTPIESGYELSANSTEDGKAKLYIDDYGKNPEIMYAEFNNKSMLLYILQNINFIKSIEMFKDVRILKFCAPKDFDEIGIFYFDIPNTEFAFFIKYFE